MKSLRTRIISCIEDFCRVLSGNYIMCESVKYLHKSRNYSSSVEVISQKRGREYVGLLRLNTIYDKL